MNPGAAWGLVVAFGIGCANSHGAVDAASKDSAPPDASAASCTSDCTAKGQACSLNRCTSMACAKAELVAQSIAGCLFYTLQADNVTADEGAETSFLVTNPGPDSANVELQAIQSGGGWGALVGQQIAPGSSAALPISGLEVTAAGVTPKAALRISSDRPVTVAEIESDDGPTVATSSGGTMILPLQSLGTSYRTVSYPQYATPDVAATAGSRGGAGRVIVIGTRDGTELLFTPRGPVTHDPSGTLPDLAAGVPYPVTLDDGDVFQIYTGAEGEDLMGAAVAISPSAAPSASAPFAVFSGNISTTYGLAVTGINSADMAHEQMPPMAGWSKTYVAAALTPQASVGCTSFFGAGGGSIWEVVAAMDGTQVTMSGPGGAGAPQNLDAGEVWTIIQPGSFTVSANHPILVTQGIDCEATLSLAVAVDATNLFKRLPFAVPAGFDLLLGVVRPSVAGAEVDLDGTAIPAGMFTSVDGKFDVAAVPLPACLPTGGSSACTHQLSSPVGFGMTLRGMDVGASFALTPPLLVGCTGSAEVCLN